MFFLLQFKTNSYEIYSNSQTFRFCNYFKGWYIIDNIIIWRGKYSRMYTLVKITISTCFVLCLVLSSNVWKRVISMKILERISNWFNLITSHYKDLCQAQSGYGGKDPSGTGSFVVGHRIVLSKNGCLNIQSIPHPFLSLCPRCSSAERSSCF